VKIKNINRENFIEKYYIKINYRKLKKLIDKVSAKCYYILADEKDDFVRITI